MSVIVALQSCYCVRERVAAHPAQLHGPPTEARPAALVTLACRSPARGPPAGPDLPRASVHPGRGRRRGDWGRAGTPWDAG